MKLCLDGGEDAEARSFDGAILTIMSPRAFAPGAPIRFSTSTGDEVRAFEGRALGSKRVEDAHFQVRLRFVNLRRADRELLVERLGN